jgi:hypothetical protein
VRLVLEPLWVDVVILSGLVAVAVALLAVLLHLTVRRLVRLECEHERLLAIVTAHLVEHLPDALDRNSMSEAQGVELRQFNLLNEYLRELETRS